MTAKLLKDPLLHFALLGLALFAVFVTLNRDSMPLESEIVVSVAQQNQLAAAFTRIWQRAPSAVELKGLLDDWVREEMAYREALAMGLAENDLVIRRRLRQKYEALMEQIASSAEPDGAELDRWYAENAQRYRTEARYTLRQRFFSADKRANPRQDALQARPDGDAPLGESIGDALGLPGRFVDASESELRGRLGEDFAAALSDVNTGEWSEPLPSAYGYHLVLVEAMTPASQPALSSVREPVLRDWRNAQLRKASEALYERLLDRYRVRFEVPEQSLGAG